MAELKVSANGVHVVVKSATQRRTVLVSTSPASHSSSIEKVLPVLCQHRQLIVSGGTERAEHQTELSDLLQLIVSGGLERAEIHTELSDLLQEWTRLYCVGSL